MIIHALRAAGLAILAAVCAYCGRATSEPEPQLLGALSLTVRYDDLDLTTDAGARRALLRIGSAAASACSASTPPASQPTSPRQSRSYQACVAATVQATVANLNAARVTDLLRQQSGGNEIER